MSLDVERLRSEFPALKTHPDYIFADNAGGSQILGPVIERLTDYLINTNVQLGASYSIGKVTNARVAEGSQQAALLMNASSPDEIVFSPSSTAALDNVARALEPTFQSGDEIIITGEHEANVGPWKKLAARKPEIVLKTWEQSRIDPNGRNTYAVRLDVAHLLPLITSRTRIVAITGCSNILGSIMPIKDITTIIRNQAEKVGAARLEICIDCVAYAPHRRIDVKYWDVDYAVFSFYKMYGPHNAALYVRRKSLDALTSLAHHFLPVESSPYKLQPGGTGYEQTYCTTAIHDWLLSVTPERSLQATFDAIALHEQELIKPLLGWLSADKQFEKGVRVIGSEVVDLTRAPTISFVVLGRTSKSIVEQFDQAGNIGIRHGHCYAYTLISALEPKIDPEDGVVRISLVFYNTVKEVQCILSLLEKII